jgi:hypothetical protein
MPLHGITNFNRRRALTPHSRAYFKVRLIDAGGRASPRVPAQLDTGADYTILPEVLATALGYLTGYLPQRLVQLANGGAATCGHPRRATLAAAAGKSPPLDVLLAPMGMPILLASRDLLCVTEFGLDATDVHFD